MKIKTLLTLSCVGLLASSCALNTPDRLSDILSNVGSNSNLTLSSVNDSSNPTNSPTNNTVISYPSFAVRDWTSEAAALMNQHLGELIPAGPLSDDYEASASIYSGVMNVEILDFNCGDISAQYDDILAAHADYDEVGDYAYAKTVTEVTDLMIEFGFDEGDVDFGEDPVFYIYAYIVDYTPITAWPDDIMSDFATILGTTDIPFFPVSPWHSYETYDESEGGPAVDIIDYGCGDITAEMKTILLANNFVEYAEDGYGVDDFWFYRDIDEFSSLDVYFYFYDDGEDLPLFYISIFIYDYTADYE